MFGDISVGTVRGVSGRRVYLKGGQQREHASHGVQEKFEGSDEIARRELVVDRDSSVEEIAGEKQGGSKVNKVIELEAGIDAKGMGGENSNKSGARVTVTVKKVKSIASGTVEKKQSEATGVSQQSEGTGVHQQSEATAVNQQSEGTGVNQQSKGCGVSSSSGDARPRIYKSIASGTGVSTQSEGFKAYSNIA